MVDEREMEREENHYSIVETTTFSPIIIIYYGPKTDFIHLSL